MDLPPVGDLNGSHAKPCDPDEYSRLLSGKYGASSHVLYQRQLRLDIAEQAIMACELMEAKEELRKMRDARDESVRMINDAKFSLMRSEHMQSSTISDCPASNPTTTKAPPADITCAPLALLSHHA